MDPKGKIWKEINRDDPNKEVSIGDGATIDVSQLEEFQCYPDTDETRKMFYEVFHIPILKNGEFR